MKENEKYMRKKDEAEDVEQLKMLEFKLSRVDPGSKIEASAKLRIKLKQKHVKKRNVIAKVYDENAVALNMKAKFTLLNEMTCDDDDEESVDPEDDEMFTQS